jgi:hypothetical protein
VEAGQQLPEFEGTTIQRVSNSSASTFAAAGEGSKRRHKKQIVSELKEFIHPSCLGLAVDSILDHGMPP